MRSSRSPALLLCLLGAVLLVAGAGATWTTVLQQGQAPLPDTTRVVPGSDLVPGLRALGVVALAGVPALLAARRTGRVVVGALLLVLGVVAAVLTVRVLGDLARAVRIDGVTVAGPLSPTVWPYAVVLGGVLVAVAGLLAVLRGRDWPVLGARFDAPTAPPPVEAPTEKSTWEALDRGEDPTR